MKDYTLFLLNNPIYLSKLNMIERKRILDKVDEYTLLAGAEGVTVQPDRFFATRKPILNVLHKDAMELLKIYYPLKYKEFSNWETIAPEGQKFIANPFSSETETKAAVDKYLDGCMVAGIANLAAIAKNIIMVDLGSGGWITFNEIKSWAKGTVYHIMQTKSEVIGG